MTDDVFNHDHRAVDDHAEIECAKRQKVAGMWLRSRQMDAKSKAKELSRDDNCAANIAEKKETE